MSSRSRGLNAARDRLRARLMDAFGASFAEALPAPLRRGALPALRLLARGLAGAVAELDEEVARAGLASGGAVILREYTSSSRASGLEHVPRAGPVLVVANHPGIVDSSALMVHWPRQDLRIVAYANQVLSALEATCAHLCLLSDERAELRAGLRAARAHLAAGGSLLSFPGGGIEPEPRRALDGAWLQRWTGGQALLRGVPEAQVVPALVCGVFTTPFPAWSGPLVDLSQLLWFRARVHIRFGPPLPGARVLAEGPAPLRAAMHALLADERERRE